MRKLIDQDEIRIARADISDSAALSRFSQLTFIDKFGHLYRQKDLEDFLVNDHSEAVYAAMLTQSDYGVWKVDDLRTGELIAYAVACRACGLLVPDMPPNAGEVKRLYVSPRRQSEGVGRYLMEAMLAWLEADGPCPLYLSVYKFNEGAQRFYARYGFSVLLEYEFMVGNHADPEYIFVRNLG